MVVLQNSHRLILKPNAGNHHEYHRKQQTVQHRVDLHQKVMRLVVNALFYSFDRYVQVQRPHVDADV